MANANFTPDIGPYTTLKPFRFWCQKVLPLVYDDSLSYYELLGKVVDYLNKTMEDVDTVTTDMQGLLSAYEALQGWINHYYDSADFEAAIDAGLDRMVEDGSMDTIITPVITNQLPSLVNRLLPDEVEEQLPGVVASQIGLQVEDQLPNVVSNQIGGTVATQLPAVVSNQIPGTVATQLPAVVSNQIGPVVEDKIVDPVEDWLDANVSGGIAVDRTLSVLGAGADAAFTGARLEKLDNTLGYEHVPDTSFVITTANPYAFNYEFINDNGNFSDHGTHTYKMIVVPVNTGDKYCINAHKISIANISADHFAVTYAFCAKWVGDPVIDTPRYLPTTYSANDAENVIATVPEIVIPTGQGYDETTGYLVVITANIEDPVYKVVNEGIRKDVSDLKSDLEQKYDRYNVVSTPGLELSMFDICPEQYSIYTYNDLPTLKHSALPSGTSWLLGRVSREITECTFRITKAFSSSFMLSVATDTAGNAIAYELNASSHNVGKYVSSASGYIQLRGITRNSLCREIVIGDLIKYVRNGTKVAFYLYDNGEYIPVADSEFFDVSQWFETTGLTSDDVSLGICTSNSARNDPLINDFTTYTTSGDHFMPYDEVDERLTSLENGYTRPGVVDLFMFMGQSNMAGRGNGSNAPEVTAGAGYEFRAITDPTKLYPIVEPFGVNENNEGGINDTPAGSTASMKSGDMIPAFVNAYYANAKVPVVGVSASEGGTRISYWQPNTDRFEDASDRYDAAVTYLNTNGYLIRHRYILWCQGESDGDDGLSKADYKTAFETMAEAWFLKGIEAIFVVKIGNYNGTGSQDYTDIMTAQNELCQTIKDVVMASTDFAGMKARGLMVDDFHYGQTALNEVGGYAGVNVSVYVNSQKEPTMYDTQDGSLYFTHKN